jgi:hypothetical protein
VEQTLALPINQREHQVIAMQVYPRHNIFHRSPFGLLFCFRKRIPTVLGRTTFDRKETRLQSRLMVISDLSKTGFFRPFALKTYANHRFEFLAAWRNAMKEVCHRVE